MSQPFDRTCKVPRPGKIDASLKEWWVSNPWHIVSEGKNLSCYERHRLYLNVKGTNFLEASYLSNTDVDGDGRAVVAGDFRNNGQMDLAIRQVGGGAFLLYENQLPRKHYLEVTLRGKVRAGTVPTSNRQGIGARLVAEIKNRKVFREVNPLNSYASQMPKMVHFGLADDVKVDRLVIRWPSGAEQILTDVPGDQHIVVEEGDPAFQRVIPGRTVAP